VVSSTSLFLISSASAQITPDNTLGAEASQVSPNVEVRGALGDRIDGGAARGSSLFHSFSEFNVNDGQRVYFANPTGIDNILSRVTGGDVSDILGTLGVDGNANLFLLNPNGFVFGPNAQLDLRGSFVTSTADRFLFTDGSQFSATDPQAPPLLTMSVPVGLQYGTPQGDLTNQANLTVEAGQLLSLHGATVFHEGQLTAPGGIVQVLGDRIALQDNSRIDVSSAAGGGLIQVGGDYQGQGSLPTALRTYVAPTASLAADALETGNGGMVIVWADEVTGFYGSASARGGPQGGNGGFVEISGLQDLIFRGTADLSAPNGAIGTLLLDPTNITIADGAAGANDAEILTDAQVLFGEGVPLDFTLSEAALEGLAGGANVVLQATDNITLEDLTDNELEFAEGPGSINFLADADENGVGDFTMADIGDTIRTNGRDISITGAGLTLGTIDTSPIITTQTFNVDAGGPIPETGTDGVANFTFTVPGDATIGTISDVDVRFSAAHTWTGDLETTLTSPNGTALELFNQVGEDGENFQDTLLDDAAPVSISNASAPFSGTFRPTGSGGLDVYSGQALTPGDVWNLRVDDRFFEDAGQLYQAGDATVWGTPALGTQLIVTTGDTTAPPGNLTLTATQGNITAQSLITASVTANAGSVSLNAPAGTITLQNIDASSAEGLNGNINLQASSNITLANRADGQNITVLSDIGQNLVLGNLNADGGDITIEAPAGIISTQDITAYGQNVAILGLGLTLGNIDTSPPPAVTQVFNIDQSGRIPPVGTVGLATFTFTIPEEAAEGTISDVNLRFSASHTWTGDLVTNLISPDGTPLELFNRVGGNGDNFQDTLLDDGASASIVNATAPFSGTFRPTGSGGFAIFNGQQLRQESTWTLQVDDRASQDAGQLYRAGDQAAWGGRALGTQLIVTTDGSDDPAGNITLDATGGDITAQRLIASSLNAAGGDVSLTAPAGTISVQEINANSSNGFGGDITLEANGGITLTDGQITSNSRSIGDDDFSVINLISANGSVLLNGTNVSAVNSLAALPGETPGLSGDIIIGARDAIQIENGSVISADGYFGRIFLGIESTPPPSTIAISDSTLSTSNRIIDGTGDSGTIEIQAIDDITLSRSRLSTESIGEEEELIGGNIRIRTTADNGILTLQDRTTLNTSTLGTPTSGDIELFSSTVSIEGGSSISTEVAATATGEGGQTTITGNRVTITGTRTRISANTASTSDQGSGGPITINARTIEVRDGAALRAETTGAAEGGDIRLGTDGVSDSILLDGGNLSATTRGSGNGGEILIGQSGSNTITLRNNSRVQASTLRLGQGGVIRIGAEDRSSTVSLESGSTISTVVGRLATQQGGNIEIVGDRITLSNAGTAITADTNSNFSTGTGGLIGLNANTIEVTNQAAITARTNGAAVGGNIVLGIPQLSTVSIDRGSTISTEVARTATGAGGRIDIAGSQIAVTGSRTRISANTASQTTAGTGGPISINARTIDVTNSATVSAETQGAARGGNIRLGASGINESILLDNGTISATSRGAGNGGQIFIGQAGDNSITLQNESQVIASNRATGQGGLIQIGAEDRSSTVSLASGSRISTQVEATASGRGGGIRVIGDRITLTDAGTAITADTNSNSSTGTGGFIGLNANTIEVADQAVVSANADGRASGGTLALETNTLTLRGIGTDGNASSADNRTGLLTNTTGTGAAGDIRITPWTDRSPLTINLGGNAQISASTTGEGRGGSISILNTNNPGSVRISGLGNGESQGRIVAESTGDGNQRAGTLNIQARNSISIQNGIDVSVSGRGGAGSGNLSVQANNVVLRGRSRLSANTENGQGGDITVAVGDTLRVLNSLISNSTVNGEAGNLTIGGIPANRNFANLVVLQGAFDAETPGGLRLAATGNDRRSRAGELTLRTNNLVFRDGAAIIASTNAGIGQGLTFEGPDDFRLINAAIRTSTESGAAGNLTINAPNLVVLSQTPGYEGEVGLFAEANSGGNAGRITIGRTNQLIISGGAQATVSAEGTGRAGVVRVNADQIRLQDGGQISARTESGQGGGVQVNGARILSLRDGSSILASTVSGTGGTLTIIADTVNLLNGSELLAEAAQRGSAGNITVQASTGVSLRDRANAPQVQAGDRSRISTQGRGTARSGNIRINTPDLEIQGLPIQGGMDRTGIFASTNLGQPQNIDDPSSGIQIAGLNRLRLDNGEISASTRGGVAGNVTIQTQRGGDIDLANGSRIASESFVGGTAGNVSLINVDGLTMGDRSRISVNSTGRGNAGNLEVEAQQIRLLGYSFITAETEAGSGGNITVSGANHLELNEASRISALTEQGVAGNVDITMAEEGDLLLQGGSRITAEGGDQGQAGNLTLFTDNFTVLDSAVTVSNRGGLAGRMEINASDVYLENGRLVARAGEGAGGTIELNLSGRLLELFDQSQINAQATGDASGGNVNINIPQGFVLSSLAEDSDIIARADQGIGGNIEIDALAIFGLRERNPLTNLSDINASSEYGPPGRIVLSTLGIDPTRGLAELPNRIVDATSLVAESCPAQGTPIAQGELVRTGRGGVPPAPGDLLSDSVLQPGLIGFEGSSNATVSPGEGVSEVPRPVVEAQGWVIGPQGEVVLTAAATADSVGSALPAIHCDQGE